MTDTNQSRFDTGRSIAEKLRAEVLETNPNTYFVQYGENDADIEPRTPLNELLFEAAEDVKNELYDLLVYNEPITWEWTERSNDLGGLLLGGGNNHTLKVKAEAGGRVFEIQKDGENVVVPGRRVSELLNYLTNDNRVDRRRPINDMFDAINENQVNRSKVERFLDRFDTDRIRPTRQGWVIDDSFLVGYDVSNSIVDDPAADIIPIDDAHDFVDLSFDVSDQRTVQTPEGNQVSLDAQEQEFLATVETFLHPEDYLGHDLSGRIISNRSGSRATDSIGDLASTVSDSGFRDPTIDGKVHKHSLDKHTLTAKFSVTDEVLDRLHFTQNTHGAVNELARREGEFRRAEFDVFHDADNDNMGRWNAIKQAARNAPISDRAQRRMDAMFGSV